MRSNVVSIDPDVAAEEKRSKAFAACMKEARALKPGDDRGVIALLVKAAALGLTALQADMLITAIHKATGFKITTLRGTWKAKRAEAEKEEKAKGRGKGNADEEEPADYFSMTETGLYQRRNRKWCWVSQPFEVLGRARDPEADHWGQFIRFKNADGSVHEEIVSAEMLHNDPNVIGLLARRGMDIDGTALSRRAVAQYLLSLRANERVTVARATGWLLINKQPAFILPNEIIGASGVEKIILAEHIRAPYGQRGTLDAWRESIATPAGDHLMLRFVIATAFAGPLLMLGGFESGLAHLYGPSSVGKTTLLKIAASVWGSGADGGYVRTWRTTANGLEATLASASDTLLPLDELGQAEGREIGPAVYMIAGALGKARMSRDTSLRISRTWRVMALSSGETPIATRLGEDQRVKRAHAGQLVRAIDVPVRRELGVFDNPYPDFDPKAFADEMKRAAAAHYGSAGPAFVRELIERRAGENVRKQVFDFADDALGGVKVDHGQAARVAERFGLIATAGRLAAEFGLVSWSADLVAKDALALFKAWLATRGGAGPAEVQQMIAQVRRFIEAHGDARFDDLNPPPKLASGEAIERRSVSNRAGFRQYVGDARRWYVLPQIWRDEVCAGFDPSEIAKNLADLGMLEPGEGGKQSQNIRTSEKQGTQRAYVLTPSIFEGWGQ